MLIAMLQTSPPFFFTNVHNTIHAKWWHTIRSSQPEHFEESLVHLRPFCNFFFKHYFAYKYFSSQGMIKMEHISSLLYSSGEHFFKIILRNLLNLPNFELNSVCKIFKTFKIMLYYLVFERMFNCSYALYETTLRKMP